VFLRYEVRPNGAWDMNPEDAEQTAKKLSRAKDVLKEIAGHEPVDCGCDEFFDCNCHVVAAKAKEVLKEIK